MSWTRSSSRQQRGSGVIASLMGVVVFLFLLLFAVQVLYGLYATSVVNAITFDAARTVAGADHGRDPSARAAAEGTARRQLGRYGDEVVFQWAVDERAVRLTVRARRPSFLPPSLAGGVGLGDVVRTVHVRTESVR